MSKLTGNKNVDFVVLNLLTDYELSQVCQVNKYVNSLCNDDNFWLQRIINKYNLPSEYIIETKEFLEFEKYKELYIYLKNSDWDDGTTSNQNRIENIVSGLSKQIITKIKSENIPDWINKEKFIKRVKREIFDTLIEKRIDDIDLNIMRENLDYEFLNFLNSFLDI